MSRRGASSTGNGTVAPCGSARLASLRQSNQAPARGTRRWHHRRSNRPMECRMPQPNDLYLGRSLVALDQDSTLIAVVEMGQASWLIAAIVPGLNRHPLKKIAADEEQLLQVLRH